MDKEAFKCSICDKCFTKTYNLNRHLINVHKQNIEFNLTIKCPLCPELLKNMDHLNDHIEKYHGIQIEKENLKFKNNEEFLLWKAQEEKTNICRFVQHRGAETRNSVN